MEKYRNLLVSKRRILYVPLNDKQHKTIDYKEILLHGYMENTKSINTCSINYILSVARLITYKFWLMTETLSLNVQIIQSKFYLRRIQVVYCSSQTE